MKKKLIAIVLGSASLMWSNNALSYLGPNDHGKGTDGNSNKAANCSPATAQAYMEFNDVRCLIEQGGSMWQDRADNTASYEVPKGESTNLTVIFAGALWMGGTDVNGQLKLAALTFRNGNDFWPGPLTVTPGSGTYDPTQPVGADAIRDFGQATIDADQCLAYDEIYKISKAEVIQFINWWECDNGISPDPECVNEVVEPDNEAMLALNTWPAHGDVSLGQDYWLAPFYDNPNAPGGANGVYDPQNDGDYPWYDDILGRDDVVCGVDRRITLYGDETHWWVFNDNGNIHTESNGDPIGMEIRAQAFAFATSDEVNRMTFYNYELINRGTQTLENTYFSQYIDADVGGSIDDYVGCDVSRGLGYAYNGDLLDEGSNGAQGYGTNPPAIGCDFFEGPYMDSDNKDNVGPYIDSVTNTLVTPTVADAIADDGIVYSGIGVGYSDGIIDNERFGMRRFTYYTNAANYPYSDPSNFSEFYNFMEGSWANGSEMYYGGTGQSGTTPSDYMFPGDSDPLGWATAGTIVNDNWSEVTASTPAGDRRFVQSAGPFILTPGAVNNITVGIVYGRGSDGTLFGSVNAMRAADTKAQSLFDACFKILEPPYAPKLDIQELENELVLMLSNPSSSNNADESYEEEDEVNILPLPGYDRFYRFEGYQIYQLVDDQASVADINDPTKAALIAQCDLENGVGDLNNFEFDEALGFAVGTNKVRAENKGIRHSFLIQNDEFAQGDRALVNHKTYYYVAVAYAHNEYKKYDPNDPNALDGQKLPYISSRLGYDGSSIKSIAAIPHHPTPEAGGTNQNISYGSGPLIRRLDGYGNGGLAVDLTQASEENIIANGYMENPIYNYGAGPIGIKVVDPLNVAGGYFECLFRDYTTTNENAADTAKWVINRYDFEGGTLLDSVTSDRMIDNKNEQIIPEWGIAVEIEQAKYEYGDATGGSEAKQSKLISSSITYADSSKRWIMGVQDNDAFYPTNWIRSGTYEPVTSGAGDECLPDGPDWQNPCNYPDELGQDADKNWAGILGGTIAPHRLTGYQSTFMPMAYYNYSGPSAARNVASLSYLPSVNIVLTDDQSKWTRCPVIELGREPQFNVGGAEPGAMRKSPSVGKNGQPDNSGTTGMGWFPGYAIDVESGARLYMSFGENSFLSSDNGADMIWNPSSRMVDGNGTPIFGGMHAIHIYSFQNKSINNKPQAYDYPAYVPSEAENLATNVLYQDMLTIESPTGAAQKKKTYSAISWVAYPTLMPTQELLSSEATIKLRVTKEYKTYSTPANTTGGPNGGKPMYSWSTDDIRTVTASQDQLAEALDMINIVPNPYYAYSEYETSRLDNRVKITNLPEVCTVRIFTSNGKLVRTYKKDSPVTSLDWDLTNFKNIPVAGGIYLIHVEIPDVGEVVLKFFGGMRQVDLQGI